MVARFALRKGCSVTRPDHARAIRDRLTDPEVLCFALGLAVGRQRQARGVFAVCPAHDDNRPSLSVRVAGDGTIACRCQACGWTGDALSLVAEVRGLDIRTDFRRVLEEAAAIAGYDLGSAPPPRRRLNPAAELAMRIDHAADQWLRGRDIKVRWAIEGATFEELGAALEVLAIADDAASSLDAEFEAVADAWEAERRAAGDPWVCSC